MTRVLLIDGESSSRLVMQSRLRETGYDVIAAENGAQGLAVTRNECFDLVLVEANLSSGVNAFEVCRRLKQTPHTAHVPVVIASKQANREDVQRGYEAGCDAFVARAETTALDHLLRVHLRAKQQLDQAQRQIRALEETQRRMVEERARSADLEQALHSNGEASHVWRELAAGRPDGLMLVDGDGIVRYADRGAHDLLGGALEGKNLGRLAPGKGLEAFVRDAHTENREGFRFDVHGRNGRSGRSLSASVVPIVAAPGELDPGLRVVILLDASRRRVASELLRMQEYTLPRKEVGALLDAARMHFTTTGLVGPGPSASRVRAQVAEAARMLAPVLIVGAPGSGRQHVARTLHYGGEWGGPFLALDCAALSREHLEVELFGQVKGAFPDAIVDRPGALQQAAHGTVYLEDVEYLPRELQTKLLRALREHVVCRAGSERAESIDVRVVASTSVDLMAHDFDRELLEVLSGVEIDLPPLRERREDVSELARYFLRLLGGGRADLELSPEATFRLENYEWPGNVRELRACIERACRLATGSVIGVELLSAALRDVPGDLPSREITPAARMSRPTHGAHSALHSNGSVPKSAGLQPWEIGPEDEVSLDLYEKKCLLRAIAQAGGNKLEAAHLLKVGKSTLYRKLKKYEIH